MAVHPGLIFAPVLLFVVAVFVGLIVLVVYAASRPPHPFPPPGPPPSPARETPLEILARRFASGEITAEDYQKGRDLLSS